MKKRKAKWLSQLREKGWVPGGRPGTTQANVRVNVPSGTITQVRYDKTAWQPPGGSRFQRGPVPHPMPTQTAKPVPGAAAPDPSTSPGDDMHMSPPVRSYGPNRMDTTSYLPTPIRPAKSGGPLGLSWVYWAGIGAAAIGVGVLVYAYR